MSIAVSGSDVLPKMLSLSTKGTLRLSGLEQSVGLFVKFPAKVGISCGVEGFNVGEISSEEEETDRA